jgi:hypothetical protein
MWASSTAASCTGRRTSSAQGAMASCGSFNSVAAHPKPSSALLACVLASRTRCSAARASSGFLPCSATKPSATLARSRRLRCTSLAAGAWPTASSRAMPRSAWPVLTQATPRLKRANWLASALPFVPLKLSSTVAAPAKSCWSISTCASSNWRSSSSEPVNGAAMRASASCACASRPRWWRMRARKNQARSCTAGAALCSISLFKHLGGLRVHAKRQQHATAQHLGLVVVRCHAAKVLRHHQAA